ncbi:hypothetical protein, partial [Streptosporangium sp. NPDC048865]|uniref:hypothetical protein n=1 Tax=Streptosporangium sp. NPDC048865 TaxID=3155766 RepID=UPI00341D98D7
MPTAGASVCSVTFLLAESLTATYSPETVVGPLGLAIEAICHRQEPLKIRKIVPPVVYLTTGPVPTIGERSTFSATPEPPAVD